MGAIKVWIRAKTDSSYGSLHLLRAQALAEAASREGITDITLLLDSDGVGLIGDKLPKGASVELIGGLTPQQEAEAISSKLKEFVPKRVDAHHKRPLVYLVGNDFDPDYQYTIWRAGAELVMIADDPVPTWADWFILPKPYAAEVEIASKSGYTHFLRGATYAPLRFASMKAIYRNSDHRTFATTYAIATENLDLAWVGKIAGALVTLKAPVEAEGWKPTLLLLPSASCPPDDELLKAAGEVGGMSVSVSANRSNSIDDLLKVDVLFSPDNTVLQEAIALGTVRVALPRKGTEGADLMFDHLVRREASPKMPALKAKDFAEKAASVLMQASFDPAWRRGQNRIGQYLCDGIGSIRIIRQTAFGVYVTQQNLVRYFEPADPMIQEI
ncbi:MAG: hypothetical protein V2A56_04650 [bacterium]